MARLALVVRLREMVSRPSTAAPAPDADKVSRQFDLLAFYERSAVMVGGATGWRSGDVAAALDAEFKPLAGRLRGDRAEIVAVCSGAARLARDDETTSADLVDLAERCFGILVSLEVAVPRPLHSLIDGERTPHRLAAVHA